MTSSTNTLVEVLAMDRTSRAASCVEIATYLATDPNPGQLSSDDYKNALIYVRDLCDETPMSAAPDKKQIAGMYGALTAIRKECINAVGEKH